jgi:uncharacterized FlgJ-related protein
MENQMTKTKLTLYVDKEISEIAKKIAKLSGKPISTLVKEYFTDKAKQIEQTYIEESVKEWIGVLNTSKTYEELREEIVAEKLKKYEVIS